MLDGGGASSCARLNGLGARRPVAYSITAPHYFAMSGQLAGSNETGICYVSVRERWGILMRCPLRLSAWIPSGIMTNHSSFQENSVPLTFRKIRSRWTKQ